ncbi:hypothetical protein TNCV_2540091 [Trichonephila clavipes]|nr:hypothetical protein TNCV_2540091 [Trichonephila clavipes]
MLFSGRERDENYDRILGSKSNIFGITKKPQNNAQHTVVSLFLLSLLSTIVGVRMSSHPQPLHSSSRETYLCFSSLRIDPRFIESVSRTVLVD